ncbi:MAG: rhodanese-like domain-containing protein [Succinivibrio sp.]
MEEFFSQENLDQFIRFFNNHQIMVLVFVGLLVALFYYEAKILIAHVKKVTIASATNMVNHEGGVYVDVRKSDLFSKGHIACSVNITLQEIKEGKLNRIESFKDKPVILVGRDKMDSDCFNGVVSLRKQGYQKVFTLDGGIAQWSMDNLPLSLKN